MTEITPNWVQFVKIWWTFTWRQALIIGLVGFTSAGLVSVVGVAAGYSFSSLDRFVRFLLIVVGLFASIVSLRSLLSTEWKGFRIAVVPLDSTDNSGHVEDVKEAD